MMIIAGARRRSISRRLRGLRTECNCVRLMPGDAMVMRKRCVEQLSSTVYGSTNSINRERRLFTQKRGLSR